MESFIACARRLARRAVSVKTRPDRYKRLGRRIASLVADEAGVAGLVCLGYPFHPVGKPDKLRVEHLKTIKTPTLILHGERDSFRNTEEVAGYKLSKVGVRSVNFLLDDRVNLGILMFRGLSDGIEAT